jgi:hypothetical protein
MPGVKEPGVLVPQLVQIDFSNPQSCIASKALIGPFTTKLLVPKLVPLQLLVGMPSPGVFPAPVILIGIVQFGLKLVGQLAHNCIPPQSRYSLTTTLNTPGVLVHL